MIYKLRTNQEQSNYEQKQVDVIPEKTPKNKLINLKTK